MALKTTPFDPAEYLDTPEAQAAYLEDAFMEGDPAGIRSALGVVARAHGISSLAEETGLTRQSLYKALSATGNPEFSTVMKVTRALGFKLVPRPVEPA
jgi:probable addiction module antidote protein